MNTSILGFLYSALQSLNGLLYRYTCPHEYTTMNSFSIGCGSFTLVSFEQMELIILKATLTSKFLQTLLISSLTPATARNNNLGKEKKHLHKVLNANITSDILSIVPTAPVSYMTRENRPWYPWPLSPSFT